ncbi:energy transducer TonB [Paraburkholderia fungorum]|jgi:protein TonB|uniref:energy transducer TonB n=1 Tax=Paraburkholderia fungorum TaxID=134537 RepID=UPI003877925A
MATVPALSAVSTGRPPHSRFGFFRAVPLALLVEGLLLGGAFVLISHKAPAPPPPVTLLTLAAPPTSAPKQPQAVPPKPAAPPIAHPLPKPTVHPPVPVHHTAPPRPATPPQPATSPPPVPVPAAAPNAPATDAPAAPATQQPPAVPPPAAGGGAGDPSFDASLRAAIETALHYPEAARMAGLSGRARVAFIYRDGAASDVRLAVSSGIGALDRAALAAVRDAVYPQPAPGLAGKPLSKQLWVTFDLNAAQ